MCTVTLIARRNGYALGMNRDEKLTRVAGLPPRLRKVNGCSVLSPSEPGGGTWISLNDAGVTLALINWYAIKRRVTDNPVSRGRIVSEMCASTSASEADALLEQLPFQNINPFRLIGVFLDSREVIEWRWDLKSLSRRTHEWRTQQWISSGFDEPQAQRIRSATFGRAQKQAGAGSLGWLGRLHRSHKPVSGPFSTCMHRADAATVSYTEASVTRSTKFMRHSLGTPCCCAKLSKYQIR